MTTLHIDSSARLQGSTTRTLTARIAEKFGGPVIRRDVSQDALPHITDTWVAANFTPADQRSTAQQETLAQSDILVRELQDADTIVIGAPVYNFGVPAALKAWIDLIARAGLTFRYTENGPIGLLTGKRAIIVIASGGTPVGSEIDFATGYLRHVLGFVGITDVEIVSASQMALDPETALSGAQAQIDSLAA